MRSERFVYTVQRVFEIKMTTLVKYPGPFVYAAAVALGLLPMRAATAPAAFPPVVEGKDGWLFFGPELRFLSFPCFWGEAASKTACSQKPENADPIPALVDFHKQLEAKGIKLFLVPVPPKAWNPAHTPDLALEGRKVDALGQFYNRLATEGLNVVDLRPAFRTREAAGEGMYCKTDSHWSGEGCVTAAKTVAKALADSGLPLAPATGLRTAWTEARFRGDLLELKNAPTNQQERLKTRQVSDASNAPIQPNPASSILILGDSHTLVFHDFLAERAGFTDQLAQETGIIPDWIGTRGSGANAVRVSLLRRASKDAAYLASKKAVVWCFAAREFTEADQGWQRLPLTAPISAK
ncbi:MAG: alginate O-acetyltransferase complex protein AlgJ [Verrucomicrobia bacterium]|nr:MAG: alginate O-acetyltransferase complex protein AlgJ [Verrucomicrobiota bacterium]